MHLKKKTKVVAVSNVKGGVSKTTTTWALAHALNKRGYKVLMIDSDPQMNLSLCFIDENDIDDIDDDLSSSKKDSDVGYPCLIQLYDTDKHKTIKELAGHVPGAPGLDIILGCFELCDADVQYSGPGIYDMLKDSIEELGDGVYDFIIVDTPPNLGILTLNAFVACDCILAPMTADSFSLRALRLLKRSIGIVEKYVKKEVPVIGLLVTRYAERTRLSKTIETNIQNAAMRLNTSVFNTRIRVNAKVSESQQVKRSIFEYAPDSNGSIDYEQFTDEFLERMKKYE